MVITAVDASGTPALNRPTSTPLTSSAISRDDRRLLESRARPDRDRHVAAGQIQRHRHQRRAAANPPRRAPVVATRHVPPREQVLLRRAIEHERERGARSLRREHVVLVNRDTLTPREPHVRGKGERIPVWRSRLQLRLLTDDAPEADGLVLGQHPGGVLDHQQVIPPDRTGQHRRKSEQRPSQHELDHHREPGRQHHQRAGEASAAERPAAGPVERGAIDPCGEEQDHQR